MYHCYGNDYDVKHFSLLNVSYFTLFQINTLPTLPDEEGWSPKHIRQNKLYG